MKGSWLLVFLVVVMRCAAQETADTASINKQLEFIYERDQKTRAHGDSAAFMDFIDSINLVYVEALIAKYGWPGKSFLGVQGNYTVFLVIQHADTATQEKYLPMLEQSVAKGESREVDLAMLKDRVLMRRGEKQIYGTQVVRDTTTGGWKFHPIEDEKNVNKRRERIGLPPIEKYAEFFGFTYIAPAN